VNEKHVSRDHCRIEGPAGGWTVTDAGSKLGTFVNGRRIRQHRLNAGDEIRVGSVLFVFEETGPRAAEGPLPHLQPLSDSAALRVLPEDEPGVEEEPSPEPPKAPRQRKILPVAVGVAVAVVGVGVLAAVLLTTRNTPERTVRRAAELLRGRNGAELWQLVAGERKIEITEEEFKEQVDAVRNEVVVALEGLQVGRARRDARGMIVPVWVMVGGQRLEDEVVLYREDGQWRIYAAPVARMRELAP
jgi:pyruvate/2-oxoglutarate dehydrogenase complex dihydrolipoamide acyltransferase (E2) component